MSVRWLRWQERKREREKEDGQGCRILDPSREWEVPRPKPVAISATLLLLLVPATLAEPQSLYNELANTLFSFSFFLSNSGSCEDT